MADDKIQRAIEFILKQQARQQAEYAASIERDQPRLARLEESFKMLVELARRADERLDKMDERLDKTDERLAQNMATLSQSMNEMVRRTISDESRLAKLEESFKILAELAHKH